MLDRAAELDVIGFICVATNMEDARECLKLAGKYDNIFAAVGVHPHDAESVADDFVSQLSDLLKFDTVVAVGEMGLDYYRNISPPEIQRQVFRKQLALACAVHKPVIIHNRGADADVVTILSEFPEVTGVAHCFSSDLKTAQTFLDKGFYISFSGNITFKNSHLPEVAKALPLDSVLVETDAPYLSPVPYRGKPNEPGRTRFVAEKLAKIFDLSLAEVAEQTTANASTLFNLPPVL